MSLTPADYSKLTTPAEGELQTVKLTPRRLQEHSSTSLKTAE